MMKNWKSKLFVVKCLFLVQVQTRIRALKEVQSSMKKQGDWRRQLSVSNTYGEVQDGRHNLGEVTDFGEYSHGPKDIKDNKENVVTTSWMKRWMKR
jgi:hypothetical protein